MIQMQSFNGDTRMRAEVIRLAEFLAETGQSFQMEANSLRMEQVISNATNNYKFNPRQLSINGQNRPLPIGLPDTDLHVVLGMRLCIDGRAIGKSNVALQTYPNVAHFTTSMAANFTDLLAFYNSAMSVKILTVDLLQAQDTGRYYRVPQTQQTLATNFSQDEGIFIEQTPNLVLTGETDTTFSIQVPSYAGWAPQATVGGFENVLTLQTIGITIRNAAKQWKAVNDFYARS